MKIVRVHIAGYGRFSDRALELALGFQVVMGPNEQGKSTLRAFITDMLYGQKASRERRLYCESHELRIPWSNAAQYGGTLIYELAEGPAFEIVRDFNQTTESVALFDADSGEEVTDEFPRLRNREVDFATVQLGLSREVFCATATVTHLTLDALGDRDALEQIRDKIVTLADTGLEGASAENAVHLLRERIVHIGRPDAKGRPLPALRARIEALDKRIAEARHCQREIAETAVMRGELREQIAQLREHRAALEEQNRVVKAHDRAARLREAENLAARIDTATQHCFALGAVREFPLELGPEVRRASTLVETARLQLERTRAEGAALRRQLDAERKLNDGGAEINIEEIPPEDRNRLIDAARTAAQLEERRAELLRREEELVEASVEAQERLALLPDFSRIAPDPVEYYTQLDKSFSIAVRARDEETAARDTLREEVRLCKERIGDSEEIFGDCADFGELVRGFEVDKRTREEQLEQRRSYIRTLESAREESADNSGFLWLAATCGAFALVSLGAWYSSGRGAILIGTGVVLVVAIYFALSFLHARRQLGHLARRILESKEELAGFERMLPEGADTIETLLEKAQCEKLRELEARYEQYRTASAEHFAKAGILFSQEHRAKECTEKVPVLFAQLQEAFAQAGVTIETERDMERAASRVLVRYQEYRDAKRRLNDCRSALERVREELKRIQTHREAAAEEYEDAGKTVLTHLWERGFTEEDNKSTAIDALRAYEATLAVHLELLGRYALLEEKIAENARQAALDEADIAARRQDLDRLLARAHASSFEQWQALETQALEYREVWRKRCSLVEQLDSVLHGKSLEELRVAVAEAGDLGEPPVVDAEELAGELEAINRAIEERTSEEHALHVTMTGRAATAAALNELEEERACLEARAQALECERDAAAQALALIETIANDRHARIAPILAAQASAYLEEITGGAYHELEVDRDLRIGIRIPQTARVETAPEKTLSQGTVDQIYLALRLALIRGLSRSGEPIPMLLDDPFSNYDDARLERTMRLIRRLSENNQVLLFTCREDVVRAAQAVGAPIMRL